MQPRTKYTFLDSDKNLSVEQLTSRSCGYSIIGVFEQKIGHTFVWNGIESLAWAGNWIKRPQGPFQLCYFVIHNCYFHPFLSRQADSGIARGQIFFKSNLKVAQFTSVSPWVSNHKLGSSHALFKSPIQIESRLIWTGLINTRDAMQKWVFSNWTKIPQILLHVKDGSVGEYNLFLNH